MRSLFGMCSRTIGMDSEVASELLGLRGSGSALWHETIDKGGLRRLYSDPTPG